MSDQEPIELPSLSAMRRGPSAAVCTSGHLLSWEIDPAVAAKYCVKCGDPIIVACPTCSNPLPADGEMLEWVPYHSNCLFCGNAYPWKAGDIARAKRTLAEQAEVERWDDAVRARANELVDDIAAERATGSGIVAALKWLEQQGAQSATPAILDAVERLATPALKAALRPTYPGLF